MTDPLLVFQVFDERPQFVRRDRPRLGHVGLVRRPDRGSPRRLGVGGRRRLVGERFGPDLGVGEPRHPAAGHGTGAAGAGPGQ